MTEIRKTLRKGRWSVVNVRHILSVLLILALVGCGGNETNTESQPEGYRQYRLTDSKLSLSFPESWDVTSHDASGQMMKIEASSGNGNTCQLFLSKPSLPRTEQFRRFQDSFKDNFGSEFENGQWVEEKKLTLNGYPTWRMGFAGETHGQQIKTRIHLFHSEDRVYVFQCMGTDPAFSRETGTYRTIAGTFRSPPE